MFNVTGGMLQAWKKWDKPLATPADIANIESSLGIQLPAEYVDFVTRFGYVLFGRDVPERRSRFSDVIDVDGKSVTRHRDVRFMHQPDKIVPRYRYMTTTDDTDDETRPSIASGFLPVAGDASYGEVLLDIAANPGQVWFWPENPDRWGLGDNVALGFVARNFTDFINSLRPSPL